jgi:hypothetical protein
MTELSIKGDASTFLYGSIIQGSITVRCDREYENLIFNVALRSVSGVSVTAFRTNPTITLDKGEHKIDFTLDTSQIVPGIYSLNPHFSQLNSFGTRQVLDALQEAYVFEITETSAFKVVGEWDPIWHGYYKAPTIEYNIR